MGARVLPFDRHPRADRGGDRQPMNPFGVRGDVDLHDLQGPNDGPHRFIVAADLCSRCERPALDLLDRAHGERICGDCRTLERSRYEAATGCCSDCGYALTAHEGRCPDENEARAAWGDR